MRVQSSKIKALLGADSNLDTFEHDVDQAIAYVFLQIFIMV